MSTTAESGTIARNLMKHLYDYLDMEPGDDGEVLHVINEAFTAIRAEAVAGERTRMLRLHKPEWTSYQKETCQREKVCSYCRGLAWPCPTIADLEHTGVKP